MTDNDKRRLTAHLQSIATLAVQLQTDLTWQTTEQVSDDLSVIEDDLVAARDIVNTAEKAESAT